MIISDARLSFYPWIQLMFSLFLVIIYSFRKWLFICSSAIFLPFEIARNSLSGRGPQNQIKHNDLPASLFLLVSFFLLCEVDIGILIAFFFHCSLQNIFQFKYASRQLARRPKLMNLIVATLIFSVAVSQISHLLCVLLLMLGCFIGRERTPSWVYQLLLILANDIHLNPGPRGYQNGFLKFMNYNLNSLAKDNFSRVQLLEAHNSIFDYDIISLCETGLNSSNESLVPKIEGYTFLSANHPDDVTHGGVGVYYKDSLPVILRDDLSFNESVVLELRIQRKKIFFTVLYRSPSHSHNTPQFQEFLENFKNLHTNICSENPYAMFFTGDFNGHSQTWWPAGNTNVEGREIEELFFSLNLTQVISEPTNFTPNCNPSCIDLIVTNLMLDSGTRLSLDPVCHHQIIHAKVNCRIPPPPPCERRTWHYQKANVDAIGRCMNSFPWAQHLSLNSDVNWQVKSFTEIILNIMSNFVPNEIRKIIPRDPPWISRDLKSMLNKKNRLYKSYKKHGYKPEDKNRLEAFRLECKHAVEAAKESYLIGLGTKLGDPDTSQKSYWKIITKVMNKSRAAKIPPLFIDNKFILDCKEKAKIFNCFFSNQCKLNINDSVLPQLTYLTDRRLVNIVIEEDEILSLVRGINPGKSNGPDMISAHMIRLCDKSLVLPLKLLFHNILTSGTYPELWKLANVTPVYKKNDKQAVNNYRPISLLPLCGKILEKIIFNSLYKHLTGNGLLTSNQSGFRPLDSTTNQLLFLLSEISESFEDPKSLEVRAVFLDISKAFDKVWHEGLLFKLKQNGVDGNLLRFFESYLSRRHQRVGINGHFSDYATVESGVPQGSVLGPLLFLIYINDLECGLKSKVKFYADDTMLYSVVQDAFLSAASLNHDLELIRRWAYQWKMEFNPDPTKQATEVLFSCKRHKVNHPPLIFNGSPVLRTDEQKHLGLILTPTLSFHKHLGEKIRKAKRNIGIIKHISMYLPIKSLVQMYKTFVRPHLDYCDVLYHEPPKFGPQNEVTLTSLMENVERIQYKAALAVTGAWQGTNRSKLYDELGWEPLSYRRLSNRILMLFKIVSNITPSYLKDKLPPASNIFSDDTILKFSKYKINSTERFLKSFFPDACRWWNQIMPTFKTMPSLSILKRHLVSLFRPNPKSIFNVHDPLGIKYLYQLRLGLSQLRSHKKAHNFQDTPSDTCLCKIGVENTDHFLFRCPFHASKRAVLASTVMKIIIPQNLCYLGNSSHLYLYGHHTLSDSDNTKIISATIKFILDSHRFE